MPTVAVNDLHRRKPAAPRTLLMCHMQMRRSRIYYQQGRGNACRGVAMAGVAGAVRRRWAIGGSLTGPILIMKQTFAHPLLPSFAVTAALLALVGPARAAHPLVSDDTGTQGRGQAQLEASTDRTRVRDGSRVAREQEIGLALTYGLTETLDLAVGLPWLHLGTTGEPSQRGIGDLTLLAKWRLHDDGQGFSLALRPEFTLPTGKEGKGLGNGRATSALTLMSQLEHGAWTWLANVGIAYNDNKAGDRKRLWTASTALLYTVTDAWTLVADVGASRAAEQGAPSEKFGLLGVIHHLGEELDLDLGWRRSLGHGPTANTLGAGLTLRW